jgi:localization factor PodJL
MAEPEAATVETQVEDDDLVEAAAPEEIHNYVADLPDDEPEAPDAPVFDPVAELDSFDLLGDSLEDSQTEARESDIFDDEPDFARTYAETEPRAPLDATEDEQTADYIARARRAAMAAAEPAGKAKGKAAPVTRMADPKSGGVKVPLLLAASAVVITGAGVGGYLYLRGKQPVAPALAGPVDTYIDPATGTAAATTTLASADRPAPLDAEQMLFEDEGLLDNQALFEEEVLAEADTSPPAEELSGDDAVLLAPTPEPVILASVQTVAPSIKPAAKIAPAPAAKPEPKLTPEQTAIRSIVTAAEAIEAGSPPSLKPAAPEADPRAALQLAKATDNTFPAIPAVVTVEAEANAGNAVAQYQFAQVKMSDGDLETAASYLRRAAQKGVAPAQYELGKLYERGQGVDKDLIEARSLIQKAAEAGHVNAMYEYALFLAEGDGGPKSDTGAVTWFEAAAMAGDEGAKQEVTNLRTRVSMTESMDANEAAKKWKAATPPPLANGRFGAQRWNTGNPLQVQAVQTALGRLGFGAGTPDGVLGPQTAAAITDYQEMEGLEVTGTITPERVDHLNARSGGTRRS